MGLGGNLMWTGFAKNMYEHTNRKPYFAHQPKFSDLLLGYNYDRSYALSNSPAFINNPYIDFPETIKKSNIINNLDNLLLKVLKLIRSDYLVEYIFFKYSVNSKDQIIYLNNRFNIYYNKIDNNRIIWRSHNIHHINFLCNNYKIPYYYKKGNISFYEFEKNKIKNLILKKKLNNFIVISTETKKEFFGKLRAWPKIYWEKLIGLIKAEYPEIKIIDVSIKGYHIKNVIQMGDLSFREIGILISYARCYVGTDSGVSHLAAITQNKSIIIWSGVITPKLLSYHDTQEIVLAKPAPSCNNCGNLGWCNNDNICMKAIKPSAVYTKVKKTLSI